LLGALTAAIPIIIHFLSRRRIRRQPFSDLRFLQEVQARQSRRISMRSLLLLLLRVLAILCVVLAVARPHLGGLAPARNASRAMLFILDASASMQTQHDGGTRFGMARALLAEMTAALPSGSEVQILLVAAAAEPLFSEWSSAAGPIAAALAGAEPTDGPCDLPQALRTAARWVARSSRHPVDIVLLSDLQRTRGGLAELQAAVTSLQGAGSVRLLVRQVGEAVTNGAVQAVHLPLRAVRPGENINLAATVRVAEPEQVFLLELAGQQVAEAVVDKPAGSLSRVTFNLTAPEPGVYRGRVVKDSDRLPADDTRPFVLRVWDQVSVLLVHGADRGPAGRGGWRYLAEALAPEGDPTGLFSVQVVASGQVAAGDLVGIDAIVFVDPDPLGRQMLGGFLSWLAAGGAAAFYVGDPTLESYLTETLLPALDLPAVATFRSRSDASRETARVLAAGHPLFNDLDREALATLGDIRWWRYFAMTEGSSQVLLSFSSEAPAMLEARREQGIFCWMPFNLKPENSDLPLSPMFLPLVQRLTAYLAQHGIAGGDRTINVGQRPELRLAGSHLLQSELDDASGLGVTTSVNPEVQLPAELAWHGTVPVLVGAPSRWQGFYTFRAGTDTVGLVAAVLPAAESDPALDSPAEFQTKLKDAGLDQTTNLGNVAARDFVAAMTGRDLSLWLLGMAFLLLCGELFIARGDRIPANP
jgi:hypothetical protein